MKYMSLKHFAFTLFLMGIILISSSQHALAANEDLMDRAQNLVDRAVMAYSNLNSYQANFERSVRKGDKENSDVIFMRFEKDFTIYMNWLSGSQKGQQLVFSEGNFDNQMLTRPPGFLFNFIPIVHLDTDDPRVVKEEKRPIQTAGIGHFIKEFSEDIRKAIENNQLQVIAADEIQLDSEEVVKLQVRFMDESREYPWVGVSFSKQTFLPIEMEFKKSPSQVNERYRYKDLELNLDRENQLFQKSIDKRLYHHYKTI